jgi:hypothetical protein
MAQEKTQMNGGRGLDKGGLVRNQIAPNERGFPNRRDRPFRHSNWDGGVIVFRGNWLYTALINHAKLLVM